MTCTSTPTPTMKPCLLVRVGLYLVLHIYSVIFKSITATISVSVLLNSTAAEEVLTMSVLGLFAISLNLLIYFWPITLAIVVREFNHVETCKDSLYMGTPPRGFIDTNLKKICQWYADKPRYVTLYDPKKRIPVYSAYTFKKTEADRRVDYPWMYEPQVRKVLCVFYHG